MAIIRSQKLGSFTIYSQNAEGKQVNKTFSNVMDAAEDDDVYEIAKAIADIRKYLSTHIIQRTEKNVLLKTGV